MSRFNGDWRKIINKAICWKKDNNKHFTGNGTEYQCGNAYVKFETAMVDVIDNNGVPAAVDINDSDFVFIFRNGIDLEVKFHGRLEVIMKVYVIEVVTLGLTIKSKISQEGHKTLEEAQEWCRNRKGVTEQTSKYVFCSDTHEYIIHEVTIR